MINKYSKVLYIPPINKDSKVLVIGGHGFIGSWLCKRLLKMGVTNLDIYDIGEKEAYGVVVIVIIVIIMFFI